MTDTLGQVVRVKAGNSGMLYDPAFAIAPDLRVFKPGFYADRAQAVSAGGRNAAWFVHDQWGHGVLRQYRRGGLVARFNKSHYVWNGAENTRSFAEFRLLQYMHAQGLPVPKVVAACYTRSWCFYRAALITQTLPNTKPLASVLKDMPATADVSALAQACAHSIFLMHRANVWHADLNAFNILIDVHNKAWLIDFDKSRQLVMTASLCNDNLNRLKRSLEKVLPQQGLVFWEHLHRFYTKNQ